MARTVSEVGTDRQSILRSILKSRIAKRSPTLPLPPPIVEDSFIDQVK